MDGLNLDRRTLVILAAILAGAVALTWVFATRQPSVQPAPLAPVAAVTAASPSASPSLSATPEVVVEAGVDTSDQNLARLLVDGEQIRIGMRAATTAPGAPAVPGAASAPGQIDLNTASVEVLQEIPGVGPVLAGRIVTFREQNGGFTSVEQLTEVSGIGEVTFAQMKPMVTIGAGG
ncbi:MAG: helix-hairpin-helix domain-containing protein [Candidatus Nanopelagicales bacterium]|nr:helix-hairpin-helix domain-containing protein [Candidatus Nanopelagicales bacterium]